jgi:uncharacterized protein with ParB-like and HNH nuclease domain
MLFKKQYKLKVFGGIMIKEAYKTLVIEKFFDDNKKQYIIPVYQRNYDWTPEDCKILFDDVLYAFDNDILHFIGSIYVIHKSEKNNNITPIIIVDGQQRITTIYLLLKALLDAAGDDESIKTDIRQLLYNSVRDDFSVNDKNKLKLKANNKDNKQLMLLMDNNFVEMDKESNVYVNYDYFKKIVDTTLKSGHYTPIDIKRGIKKLLAVYIQLEDANPKEHKYDPQQIFERINATGKPLGIDDLIRNYILMTDLNQENLFEKYWLYIETNIPKERRSQFFIDYLNSYTTGKITVKDAYDSFKLWQLGHTNNSEECLALLKRAAKYYTAFIGKSLEYSADINEQLEGLRRLNQSTIYTFLFHVFDDYEDKVITEETLVKVLKLMVNYTVRRIVCEIASNSLNGLYKTLYKRVFSNVDKNNGTYYDAIVCMLIHNLKNTKDGFPSDNLFVEGAKTTKLYSRSTKVCKYLLGLLENYNSNEKINVDSDKITIEHILPQNFENKDWRSAFGADYDRIYNTYLDTLGNITLTGYNSNLSDNSFSTKQKKLIDCGTKILFLNKEFYESPVWDERTIKDRAIRLSDALKRMVIFPQWTGTDYNPTTDKEYVKVTLNNISDSTGRKPVYYEFCGERNDVKTWKDALGGVFSSLYSMDGSIFKHLTHTNFKPKATARRKFFSYNEEDLSSAMQIATSGIYFETNLQAEEILEFLLCVLEQYDWDVQDFAVFTKQDMLTTVNNNPDITMQIGQLAKSEIIRIISSGKLDDEELLQLYDKQYSHDALGTNYPVLSESRDANKGKSDRIRYAKEPFEYKGKKIFITNEWLEISRKPLLEWIEHHQ